MKHHRDELAPDRALPGATVQRMALGGVAISALAMLAACGGSEGGGGITSTPAPTPTATASTSASPTPTPTATATSSFQTAEYYRSTGPAQHGAITAWSMGATGAGVTIGIVDSGLDTSTGEFTGRVSAASADVAGSRGLTNADSDHGTAVALVAAAARNNVGVMGIAYGATIAAFRADTTGSCATSAGCSFADTDIATGVNAAITAGARVINLSLGGSAPGSTMIAAINRAASAGVVVVVSAGNDASANPDAFAAAVRAAGNGNVIIAGSVDSSGTISSFSDKAGTEAAYYLTALGEQVCCQYANGAIKTTTSGGQTYVTVYSGTSFSAPQIAGAVALLLQYFPKLTAKQAVTLLLSTATTKGTGAGDTTYGAGVLNIAKAFTAQGTTSLAGAGTAQIALGDTTIVTSPAMGDAAAGASLSTIVLDSYNRAFSVDLAASMRHAMVAPRLLGALDTNRTASNVGNDTLSLAFTVDGHGVPSSLTGFARAMRLSPVDAGGSHVLAARMVAHLAPGSSIAMAFADGADGITAQLQGQSRPAFLIAANPLEDVGFARGGQTSMAVRNRIGPWGVTVSAENARSQLSAPWRQGATPAALQKRDGAMRLGLALDRKIGVFDTTFGASWLNEAHTMLGARLADAFGARGADSMFLDGAMTWRPGYGWYLGGAWRQAFTHARGGTLVGAGSALSANGWAVDAGMTDALTWGDSLSLRVSQPLRVSHGGLNLLLPESYDYTSGDTAWSTRRLNLAPTGREIATELAWRGPLWRGDGMVSLFWRKDPGHYAALPDDGGVAVTWRKGF